MDKLKVIKHRSKCKFCGLKQNNPLKYGVLYKLGNIVAHYFCVLLSSSLVQNGKDDEGMLGFLYSDIQKELKRTSQVLCFFCNTGNASLKCSYKGCRKRFHYPCGLRNGTLSQFKDNFKSFCHKHRPVQDIPKHILQEAYKVTIKCCICYEEINVKRKKKHVLWAPCCLKNWFHIYCIQKLACSAGYFFKCPACNDVQKFSNYVQDFGIFIPQQDASWELVPNAYTELQFRYNKCDAKVCLCPLGREGNKEDTTWEIILCESCGSQGIHAACAGLQHLNSEWECSECQKVTKSFKFTKASTGHKSAEGSSETLKLPVIHQKKRCRGSEDLENLVLDKRKKCRQEVQEEEIEIDVVTVDEETKDNKTKWVVNDSTCACKDLNGEIMEITNPDPQEVLTLIRPGPLSYKLGLIRNALKNSQAPLVPSVQEKKEKEPNLIVITDSEEETEETDDDIEVVEFRKGTLEKHPPLNSPKKWNSETTDSISIEREKAYNSVFFSNDFTKPAELSLSLSDFDILAVMRVHSSGDQKDEDPIKPLSKFGHEADGTEACEKYLSVYPVAHNKSLPWCTEKETCVEIQDKLIQTDTIRKDGLVQFIDDVTEF